MFSSRLESFPLSIPSKTPLFLTYVPWNICSITVSLTLFRTNNLTLMNVWSVSMQLPINQWAQTGWFHSRFTLKNLDFGDDIHDIMSGNSHMDILFSKPPWNIFQLDPVSSDHTLCLATQDVKGNLCFPTCFQDLRESFTVLFLVCSLPTTSCWTNESTSGALHGQLNEK